MSLPAQSAGMCAIVLAAGKSARMGRPKMLLPFGDRPMLARVIESLRYVDGVFPVIVVTGHNAEEIGAVVVEFSGVECVHNVDSAAGGMLSSVKVGVAALPSDCRAFFLVLGDQPMVQTDTIAEMESAWHRDAAPIVVPAFQGKRGHPVLLSSEFATEILALSDPDTLKTVVSRDADRIRVVEVNDPAVTQDIDTPEDYEAALKRWNELGSYTKA